MIELRKKEKERKQHQQQLQKLKILIPQPELSQQEYYHFLHHNGASMVIITISSIILDANSLFCQSVNHDYSQVIGSSFFSFAHSSTLPFLYSYYSYIHIFIVVHLALFYQDQKQVVNLYSISPIIINLSLIVLQYFIRTGVSSYF